MKSARQYRRLKLRPAAYAGGDGIENYGSGVGPRTVHNLHLGTVCPDLQKVDAVERGRYQPSLAAPICPAPLNWRQLADVVGFAHAVDPFTV
jgi:hypothetical protein